ncbi:ABC-2 family transporter protein [Oscillatoriales cyanobacterium LEGE 11467]|uniref:ABC-2 family transporter protein n=1 Tax=Zarconia navalis LEGE 11467 TaxID=1828826 RepID=A0A928VTN1_9CYAN|nr:ABC-2 family transporter protein [Zarconia navalis]MBE9040062.1 ABC-2 family transporter protein [Zarconia navalis LEGE 11467]
MQRTLKTIVTLLSTYYAYVLEYRAELFFWVLSGSLPFILMGIWMKASATGQFGLSPVEFARYFLAAFIVRQFNVVWVIWDFEKEVVEGKLSPRLLQPIDPGFHHLAGHASERVARLPFIFGLVLLFFTLYPESLWFPTVENTLCAMAIVPLVFLFRFLVQYTFALLTFWIERASAVEQLWLLPYFFLSGLVAPLEMFPDAVREVVMWTPFPYFVYFPASILVGLPVNVGRGLVVILAWMAIFWVLNRWLWRQGLKQYSGMGA